MKNFAYALVLASLIVVSSGLSAGASTLTAASLPIPSSQQSFAYPPTAAPETSSSPSLMKPIGVGPVADGGDALDIRIGLDTFAAPVDAYVLLLFPALSPDLYVWTESSLEPFPSGFSPWKQNTPGPITTSVFGPLSVSGLGLPPGNYHLGLLVTPAGVSDLSVYYLWFTQFSVAPRDGFWSGSFMQFHMTDHGTRLSPDATYIYPGNALCSLVVGPFAECGYLLLCIYEDIPVKNGAIDFSNGSVVVKGTFSSATTSSGTYSVDINSAGCDLQKQGQWNAHFVR